MSPQHSSLPDLARHVPLHRSRKHLKVSCLHCALPRTAVTAARSHVEHCAELRPGMAQAPHRAVREGGALPEGCGVFVSRWHHGSPAHRYALYALQFVQEVNGVPTPDLEAFVKAISSLVRVMCPILTALHSPRTAADIQAENLPPFWTFPADSLRPSMPKWQPDHKEGIGYEMHNGSHLHSQALSKYCLQCCAGERGLCAHQAGIMRHAEKQGTHAEAGPQVLAHLVSFPILPAPETLCLHL